MTRRLSENLWARVEDRANGSCEYCRIRIDDTYFGGEIDHIISIKHQGQSNYRNLAFACQPCNRNKGTDLGSVQTGSGKLIRFYNPRSDNWHEHFRVNSLAEIEHLSEIGEVTALILGFNHLQRIAERKELIEIGHFMT